MTTLARLVASVRDTAQERLWRTLAGLLTPEQEAGLVALLDVPAGDRYSTLDGLRSGPRTPSGLGMVKALHRVSELAGIGVSAVDLLGVLPRRVVELARYGMAAKARLLRRHPPARRAATLLATVRWLHANAIDDALELFDVLMSTELKAGAERETTKEKLRRYPRISRDAGRLALAVEMLLDAADRDESMTVAQVWEAFEHVVSRDDLRASVSHVRQVLPPVEVNPDGEWRATMIGRYASVRGFVPLLCQVIDFGATGEGLPVLAAMRILPDLLDARPSKRVPAGWLDERRIDAAVVPAGWWRRLVYPPDRPEGAVHRAGYVFCLLEQFHDQLMHRAIYAPRATKWADPRVRLLAGAAWELAKGPALRALQLSEDPDEPLADCAAELDAAWRQVGAGLDQERPVRLDDQARLHVQALDAIPEPPSLLALRERVEAMLPELDLPELVLEVMSWDPRLLEAFRSVSGGDTRLPDLLISITAALMAYSLNVGYAQVISEGTAALTGSRISHVDQNYLRPDTYAAFNGVLIDLQADVGLAQAWGGGYVAAVDGMRFVVPLRTIHARPNPRYFGRKRGATWLTMVSDHAVGTAGPPRDLSLTVLGPVGPDLARPRRASSTTRRSGNRAATDPRRYRS